MFWLSISLILVFVLFLYNLYNRTYPMETSKTSKTIMATFNLILLFIVFTLVSFGIIEYKKHEVVYYYKVEPKIRLIICTDREGNNYLDTLYVYR